jgi:type I restriction enzyme S subunit
MKWLPLDELGEFYSGLTGKSKKDFLNGNNKFITYMNVFSNIAVKTNIKEFVKIGVSEKQNKVEFGDVLFTLSSETLNECGMSSVLTKQPEEPLYLNSFCFGFRLWDKSLFLPDFMKYLFRCDKLRKQAVQTASGVTRFNVSRKKFAKIKIPVPPIEVQEEIVRVLDTFTQLESELESELELRTRQYEYYRSSLLSFESDKTRQDKTRQDKTRQDKTRQGKTRQVKWAILGEIGKVSMCKRIMKNQTSSVGDIPFYKIGTFGKKADAYIKKEVYEEYKNKYSFPKLGDILLSASGTIGRRVIYDGKPAYFQDSNIVWIDNDESKIMNKFLYYLYETITWQTEGGTIKRLYNANVEKTKIPIPPMSEQKRIVGVLDRFDSLVNDISVGLPAELSARRKQYEYYRDKLLTFKEVDCREAANRLL